jgi:UDP-N-acetylmuramate--alanine ligase
LYQNVKHPEYLEAKSQGKNVTWDEFVGKYLLKGKENICITGTHGKSTTTSMAALLFEAASYDPSAIIGAKINQWGTNYRVGKSKYFIIEADDFYNKFYNYKPSTAIINNIEFDHPDFFKSEEDMMNSYLNFVKLLQGKRNLIVNQDSEGNKILMKRLGNKFLKKINVYGYTLGDPQFNVENSFAVKLVKKSKTGHSFEVAGERYDLKVPGEFNISNALGVIILSKLYGIDYSVTKKSLLHFKGTVRRLELVGESEKAKVYDDYAHHPTAIKLTIDALREKHPDNRLWIVVELHSYSRTKALLSEFKGIFKKADKVIIGPIFKARDKHKHGVSEYSVVKASEHTDIKFIPSHNQIVNRLKKEIKKGDIVCVMGAGKSYLWAREIVKLI